MDDDSNRQRLQRLLDAGAIRLRHAPLLDSTPEPLETDDLEMELEPREACDHWYSGAYMLETVPSVLYILARHGHDPEEAVVRAVNDTRDNDTVAAIVGAAVGALHGASALPGRWREDLLGRPGADRTDADDDGRVFDLIDQAVERWV